ncbi:MAG: nuclear transport factor 2 family protein [Candidatus Dormibacteraeota bacterium]|nr:nuclear transport factor 2 family protein [Candidatus Dormibacteraeota bacterium]
MTMKELDAVLDSLIHALADRDLVGTLDCLSSEQELAVAGSEAGEMALGRSEIEGFFRRIYARPQPFLFDFPERSRSVERERARAGQLLKPSASSPYPCCRLTSTGQA